MQELAGGKEDNISPCCGDEKGFLEIKYVLR